MKVLFIVVDSLRADAPGFAGGDGTPTLDELARNGTHVDGLFVSGAWTIPSLMSMLTGTPPHLLAIARWRHPYPAGWPNLFTAFNAAGFAIDCCVPHPEWGLLTLPGRPERRSSQDVSAVVEALRSQKSDHFVFIHHWWTHLPYITRELGAGPWFAACEYQVESLGKYPRLAVKLEESYRAAVTQFSEEVLPRYIDAATSNGETALIIVTGDHGENWGSALPPGRRVESVYDLHGRWITDETIRVPFIVSGLASSGAVPAGHVVHGMAHAVRGVDVGPTVAELAGIPWPGPEPVVSSPRVVERGDRPEFWGRSLAPLLCNHSPSPEKDLPEIVTITSHNAHQPRTFPGHGPSLWRTYGIRRPDGWVIWDGIDRKCTVVPEGARREQAVEDDKSVEDMVHQLERERLRAVDSNRALTDEEVGEMSDDQRILEEHLQALGYLD